MKLQATITLDYSEMLFLDSIIGRYIVDRERDALVYGDALAAINVRDAERARRIGSALDDATTLDNMKLIEA